MGGSLGYLPIYTELELRVGLDSDSCASPTKCQVGIRTGEGLLPVVAARIPAVISKMQAQAAAQPPAIEQCKPATFSFVKSMWFVCCFGVISSAIVQFKAIKHESQNQLKFDRLRPTSADL